MPRLQGGLKSLYQAPITGGQIGGGHIEGGQLVGGRAYFEMP